jgi:hypothetical protein
MAKCDYCNSNILFGGVKQNGLRFCNNKCYQSGYLLNLSQQVPADVVKREVDKVHQGLCPRCQKPGPVDIHTSHQVYSMLILTRWSSKPQLSCQSCGRRSQIEGAVISFFAGWWGFPWGLIFTPVQITRNIAGMLTPPKPTEPSYQLEKIVRLHLASQLAAKSAAPPTV